MSHYCTGTPTDRAIRLEVLDALGETPVGLALQRYTEEELGALMVEADDLRSALRSEGLCARCGRALRTAEPAGNPWRDAMGPTP